MLEVYRGQEGIDKRVIMVGGGLAGCETALTKIEGPRSPRAFFFLRVLRVLVVRMVFTTRRGTKIKQLYGIYPISLMDTSIWDVSNPLN